MTKPIAYILRWGDLYLHPEVWETGQRGCRRFVTREEAVRVLEERGAAGMAKVVALVSSMRPGQRVLCLHAADRRWYSYGYSTCIMTRDQRRARRFETSAKAHNAIARLNQIEAAIGPLTVVRLRSRARAVA